jgi:sugar phosphate isomerase/epimerase
MKLGLLTEPYRERSLADLLPELATLGVEAIELGTGNYPGDHHCPLDRLLDNKQDQAALLALVERHGMMISALSQHGNPLHPRRAVAEQAHETWRKTVRLAAQLGVPVVNAFSGCPGDKGASTHPNWVTCAWPPEYRELRDWQWGERVLPYWTSEARFAAEHGVRVAIEMHPGFVVYNPTTLLDLRRVAGESIGANFDPSHLFWQGIDPVESVELLASEGAIFHVHAKDTELNDALIRRKGVLDLERLERFEDRSWSFRTVGLGHTEEVWRAIVAALADSGYDYVVSVEHEDDRLDAEEGIALSLALLQAVLAHEARAEVHHHRSAPSAGYKPAVAEAMLPEGGTDA